MITVKLEFLQITEHFNKENKELFIFTNNTPIKVYHNDILYKNFSYESLYKHNAVYNSKFKYENNNYFGKDDVLEYYLELYDLVENNKLKDFKIGNNSICGNSNLFKSVMNIIWKEKGFENWVKFKEKLEKSYDRF